VPSSREEWHWQWQHGIASRNATARLQLHTYTQAQARMHYHSDLVREKGEMREIKETRCSSSKKHLAVDQAKELLT
jgi:hypothetical protein